ncbi:MAG: dihydrolipoyl dehydrogenase [marine bacterium B5-7]|nr:MAG: dihydrolipoyl dehydrogenase [marine bacterium B5-7]
MSITTTVKVPDIGDFEDIEIIEILVGPGDSVEAEDPLITLESDKATMDVPSPVKGVIKSMNVSVGDRVSEGSVIAGIEAADASDETTSSVNDDDSQGSAKDADIKSKQGNDSDMSTSTHAGKADLNCALLVLGSGPGGYTAAFRAADLGVDTVLVERFGTLGGVCLNVGCIPSKALLHMAKVLSEADEASEGGVTFSKPKVDIKAMAKWKQGIVSKLTGGLAALAKKREVKVVTGVGKFIDDHHVLVTGKDSEIAIRFDKAIIAAGSRPVSIQSFPDDPRIMDSTGALDLKDIPEKLLVVGGGIIGLEMATVYEALGSKVTVVEMLDSLIAGADADIVKPLHSRINKRYDNIFLNTKVTAIKIGKENLEVYFEGDKAPASDTFDQVLVSVGRRPNGDSIDASKAGVSVDDQGFIATTETMQTNVEHIFAIGDIVGQPMLAHKAVHEGKVAAEVVAGMKSGFEARVIPSVAYTDPEVAWVGVTEREAKEQNINYGKGIFPWAASGRSLSIGRSEGITKLLFDEDSGRLIGAGIVGTNAGDLIAEAALAIETGCDAADISLTIHPHPTLSETIGFSAEAFEGTITDLYIPKKK